MDDLLFALDLLDLGFNLGLLGDVIDPPFWTFAGVPPELKAALEDLTGQIEANPKDADAYCKRGAVCQGLGHPAEAYADFTACLRLQPRNARAWLLLSECLVALHHYDQARSARRQALEIDPRVEA